MVRDASIEMPEKLGSISVSDTGGTNTGPPIRTSARVHKKMRLDAAMASERKESEAKDDDAVSEVKDGKIGKVFEAKSSIKSSDPCTVGPSSTKLRRSSPSWSAEEQDIFFQALNEYGKDFEKIQSVLIAKAHEKDVPENLVKSKEQIRLFYLRTWHKLSKHLKFSPDVKRGVQELYALINYGEFRKSVGLLTKRSCVKLNELIHRGTCVKLNELIHHGHAHFRIRGKYVRVKTPQCPTLQKLNKLDVPECKEGKEELQLPPRVVVELRPRSIGDWCRVQSVAQNPRVRTLLPLDQRISSLLAFLQQRWRPPLLQHRDELLSSILLAKLQLHIRADHAKEPAPLLHIAPPPNARITLHSFCLSEYLTSASLSLSAYRERLSSRESLPTLPRRMQVALSRSLNRSRLDTMKSNLSLESANHKKPCVLGKDVEAMVAAAAAAAAAIEAKVKAAALAEQTEGTSLDPDLTPNKDMDVSVNPLAKSSLSSSYTVTDISESDSTKTGNTGSSSLIQNTIYGIEDCESGLLNKNFGNIATDVQREKDTEKDSESEVQAEGESEFELETEVEVPVDTEAAAPQEVPAQISGEMVSDNKVKTEVDAKVDTKSEVKIRAQIRKEKAAAKIEEIKQGWSLENAHAVTIGELYLMFGHEGKVELEYWWEDRAPLEEKQVVGNEGQVTTIASALQKLVSITKLNYKKTKVPCPCGHVCEDAPSKVSKSKCGGKNAKENQEKSIAGCSNIQEKPVPVVPSPTPVSIPIPVPLPVAAAAPPRTIPHHMLFPTVQDGVFRRPLLAPMYRTNPRTANVEAIKAQLEKFRPKYCNRRGRAVRQKGVVVQRMLPLLPKVPDGHAMLALKVIPQTATKVAGEYVPIRPQPEGFSYSSQAATSTLHMHSNDPGVIRRQQLIQPKLLPSTSINMSGNLSALDCSDNLQLQQIQPQDQIITVSIGSSNCSDVQQQLCNDLGSIQQSTEERPSPKKNEVRQSSPSAISSPPPSISHLLDLDGGSTVGDDISLSGVSCGLLDAALASSSAPSTSQNFSGLLSDVSEAYPSSPPLVKLPDQQWLNSEVGDFSLGSLLGHLESPAKANSQVISLSSEESSDVEAQLQCLMSENSVDYSAKFAVLAAQIAAAAAENKK